MIVDFSVLIALLLPEPDAARFTAEPLLFKGNDFSQTDLVSALPRS